MRPSFQALARDHDPLDRGLRDAWETMIVTGRRCSEVLELRLDCLGRYGGLPMLWHDQTKVGNYDAAIRIPERAPQKRRRRYRAAAAPGPRPRPRLAVAPGPGHPAAGRAPRGIASRRAPRRAPRTHGRAARRCRRARGAIRPAAGGAAPHGEKVGGVGRARIREAPQFGAAPVETATRGQDGASQPPAHAPGSPGTRLSAIPQGPTRAALPAEKAQARKRHRRLRRGSGRPPLLGPSGRACPGWTPDPAKAALPFAAPHPRSHPGRPSTVFGTAVRLRPILWRQWDAATTTAPPPQAIAAIERLAELPRALQEKLADGLDGIYVGAGGVPDLDDMGALHGVQLPSGKATWDACAGRLRRPQDRGGHPAVTDPGRHVPRGRARAR